MPMANDNDASTDPLEKPPAKVVARKRTSARSTSPAKKAAATTSTKSTAKKTPAAKTPAKKAPAKKAPAKKAAPAATAQKTPAKKTAAKTAAKKAPVKKAPAKKAAVKKAPAKKAVAKKAPAKKAVAKKAPVTPSPAKRSAAAKPVATSTTKSTAPAKKSVVKKAAAASNKQTVARTSQPRTQTTASAPPTATQDATTGATKRPTRSTQPQAQPRSVSSTQPTGAITSAALAVSVTEGLLNDIAAITVGAGVSLDPIRTEVPLPGVGDIAVDVELRVVTAHTELQGDADGSIRVHVTAEADLKPADDLIDPPVVLPLPPAPIPLIVAVLVQPTIELDAHAVRCAVPTSGLKLERIEVDTTVPAPEGVESNMWISMLAIFNMMLSQMGGDLFENLLSSGPKLEFEVEGTAASLLDRLGAEHGRAVISVSEKLLTVTFPGQPNLEGNAWPVPIAGKRAGVALSATSVNEAARFLLEQAVSGLPVPFDIEVSLGEQHVASRIRQSRILPAQFPDLRSALRSEVRTRLVRGRVELSVEALWFETPDILPGFINDVSRRLGGLAGLAPLKIKLPEQIEIPLPGDSSIGLPITVDDLRVSEDGVGAAVMLA